MQEQVRIIMPEMHVPGTKETEELSDEICILRFCEQNDEAAFDCLVKRYSRSIRRIIFTIIREPEEDIEDLGQEILLSLYRNLSKFSFRSSFKTYLFRMCRNKAIDFTRKRKRLIKVDERARDYLESVNNSTPETIYIRQSERDEVMKVIFKLKEKERSLIIMKDVENLSIAEIAAILKKPVGTVKSRLHRARIKATEKITKGGIK